MRTAKTLAACLSVVFLLILTASSVRADSLRAGEMLVKLNGLERHNLNLPEENTEMAVLFAAILDNDNNGKHLGFSVASTNRGNKFGLFKGPHGSGQNGSGPNGSGSQSSAGGASTIPNPEPAAVFLLGTGLAAVGAYARKRFRKPNN